jgi:hypothetical protein
MTAPGERESNLPVTLVPPNITPVASPLPVIRTYVAPSVDPTDGEIDVSVAAGDVATTDVAATDEGTTDDDDGASSQAATPSITRTMTAAKRTRIIRRSDL